MLYYILFWTLLGFKGKREERLGAPQGLVRIGLGGGAAPPPSFSSPSPFLDSYSYYLEGGKGKRGRGRGKGAAPPSPSPTRIPLGRGRTTSWLLPSLSPLRPIRPITSSGGVPVTLRHSDFLRKRPEHFRCPNIVVQYINLHVFNILRLLVMSVITCGTPNCLRYIITHKLII